MVTRIKGKWLNGILTFYDEQTFERVDNLAPVSFYDDFLGAAINTTDGLWALVDVAGATEALVASAANGVFQLALTNANEAQDAVLYWGDQRGVDVGNKAIFEARVKLSVLPTGATCAVWGMANAHNLAKDSVTVAAWFRADGSGVVKVETDDTTNDNDDVATGVTVLATEWHIYRIDFSDLTDVKFYIDGVRVAGSTTFDMSNLTAAEQVCQPYFSLDKAAATTVGTMQIDYVRMWSQR